MNFKEIFNSPKPVFSFEFFPPRQMEGLEDTRALMRRLAALNPDFMTVTYGAGGGTRELTRELTSFIARELHVPSVAHLTCANHTVAEIDEVVEQLVSGGIKHILALRGDPPKGLDKFLPHPEGFSCARDLVQHLKKRADLSLAVAGYPEPHPDAFSPDEDLKYLKQKVDAGAEVIITQLFFEPELYFRFRDTCEAAGISVPIVPGILPIRNVSQVKRFTALCGASIPVDIGERLNKLESTPDDVVTYGIELATRICSDLLRGGAPGIHLYTLNKGKQIEQVYTNLQSI